MGYKPAKGSLMRMVSAVLTMRVFSIHRMYSQGCTAEALHVKLELSSGGIRSKSRFLVSEHRRRA
jgi:hypothetical protein